MSDFIIQSVIFVSLAVLLFLILRALPKMEELKESDTSKAEGKKYLTSINLEKADDLVGRIIEKFLRRLKIFTLRFDNVLSKTLGKIKSKSDKTDKPDFTG